MAVKEKKKRKFVVAAILVAVVLAVSIPVVVFLVSKAFTAQEQVVRTDWAFDTGDIIEESQEFQVDIT